MKVKIRHDKFASIRPWKWWIEDDKGVINWGGDEWTAEDAEDSAQNALLSQFSKDIRDDFAGIDFAFILDDDKR